MNNQFLETFLNEWSLYQKQGGTPTVDKSRSGKRADDFDRPVRAGEIRVFADSDRQMVGLVYKSWGEDGWVIIPVSEFTVPATEQEILIGTRVYQLWNAFTATASFVEKSWLIDILSSDDQQDICAALLHVTIGEPIREDLAGCLGEKISFVDDPRLEYERTFVVNRENAADVSSDVENSIRKSWLSRDRVAKLRQEYGLDDWLQAAATRTDVAPFIADRRSWKGEGCNASDFDGYSAGSNPKTVVFTLITPDGTSLIGKRVEAFKKDEESSYVGAGIIYEDDGEIKVDIIIGGANESVGVASVSDLILVLAEE